MADAGTILRTRGRVNAGLPTPRVEDASLQRWIEAISQMAGNLASEYGVLQALRRSGLLTQTGEIVGGGETGIGIAEGPLGVPVLTVAPVPTGLTARCGIGVCALFWDNPFMTYANHGVTRVYRHTADEFNNAVEIGTSTGISYVDESPSDAVAETYWYWIRWETTGGGLGLPSESVMVQTSPDPAVVIARLTQEILNDPLARELLSPGLSVASLAVLNRISQHVAARLAAIRGIIDESLLRVADIRLTLAEDTLGTHTVDIAALEARLAGVNLGPEQNAFSEATRAEAEAARDDYGTVNLSWLAQYDADSTLNIRLVYGVFRQYQRRVNNAWVNNGEEEPTVAAISALNATVIMLGADIIANTESITLLTTQVGGLATVSALNMLSTRVTTSEGDILAQGMSITQLMLDIDDRATVTALQTLAASVDVNATGVESNAEAITALQSEAGGVLGPEQNTFTGATEDAAASARDGYEAANPAWLAMYEDLDVQIQLEWN